MNSVIDIKIFLRLFGVRNPKIFFFSTINLIDNPPFLFPLMVSSKEIGSAILSWPSGLKVMS